MFRLEYRRDFLCKLCFLLKVVSETEHIGIVQKRSCEMKPKRTAAMGKARRHRNRRKSCEVRGDRVDVLEVHLERVWELVNLESCGSAGWCHDHLAFFERFFKLADDEQIG